MKEDWDLDVEMPLDRLTPTIPLRLNYILWLEDLVAGTEGKITGIDTGNALFQLPIVTMHQFWFHPEEL